MTAEEIVRKAATEFAPIGGTHEFCCVYCDADPDSQGQAAWTEPSSHSEDCVWRLAREWLADNTPSA